MKFDLTEQLLNNIISAMENQNQDFVVDAASGNLIENTAPDEDAYYSLPEWGPSEGFSLRESFVDDLHSPIVHDELQSVLHSGRGVFKNFRNILKDYPEIDKRWHIYKNRYMSARVNEWYNDLREIWGLEKLDQSVEAGESLVQDDFSFIEYDSAVHKQEVLLKINAGIYDDEKLPLEVNKAFYELWKNQFEVADSTIQTGYICRSLSDDFAGCITVSSLTNQEQIMFITSLFVPEQFRGLGICTELILKCISKLQSSGKKFIIMPNSIAPDVIQSLLIRTGFEKINSGFILAL